MSTKAMDKIAEQGAWRISVGRPGDPRLQLYQGIASGDSLFETQLHRVEFFPHINYSTLRNRARIIQKQQKILEKFQILLKLLFQSSTQCGFLLSHRTLLLTMVLEVARIEPQQVTCSETFKKIEVILVRDGDTLRDEQGREVEAWGRPGN